MSHLTIYSAKEWLFVLLEKKGAVSNANQSPRPSVKEYKMNTTTNHNENQYVSDIEELPKLRLYDDDEYLELPVEEKAYLLQDFDQHVWGESREPSYC